ncbi:MAG: hypothetical protein HN742_43115 [Lentisphaerae bacterium]|jgi:hypothetical protein|nr:hypothetical protein [Lentisphaerota bacterium]MBT4822945.1 hypothetical protein [Lentisphaerota bacterium]MBT5604295.1 hypothetical protein [Lentisphaerota bacterium]MBT7054469.1 hypothetical protein [Lentisphaerota bacterium]MBT7848729.1 hypothetical protein [Lentisphaerota bacterium]
MSRDFTIGDVHDVADNVLANGWRGPAQVNRYFADCVARGVDVVGWRLSGVGDFLHHSQIENSPFDNCRWGGKPDSAGHRAMRKHDFLKLGAVSAQQHGIAFLPHLTMCDEGWFPRFKGLAPNVEAYYRSEGLEFLIQDDDYIKKPGLNSLSKWLENPETEILAKYARHIPAVEQSQRLPPEHPWSCLTRFAREHPEYAAATKGGFRMGRMLSYAYPAVRRYKMQLFREAAAHGCDGFILDYHRWSDDHDVPITDANGVAVTGYEQPAVDLFREKYGKDAYGVANNDPDWIRCRAEIGPTRFIEELRQEFPNKLLVAMVPLNDPLRTAAFADVEDWAARNLIDAVLVYCSQSWNYYDPLLFTSDYPEAVQRHGRSSPIQWTHDWLSRIGGQLPVHFYVNTRCHDETDPGAGKCRDLTERELYEQVRQQKEMGTSGAFFYQNYNAWCYRPVSQVAENSPFSAPTVAWDTSGIRLELSPADHGQLRLSVTFADDDTFLPDERILLPSTVTVIIDGSTVLHRHRGAPMARVEEVVSSTLPGTSPHRVILVAEASGHSLETAWEIPAPLEQPKGPI